MNKYEVYDVWDRDHDLLVARVEQEGPHGIDEYAPLYQTWVIDANQITKVLQLTSEQCDAEKHFSWALEPQRGRSDNRRAVNRVQESNPESASGNTLAS